MAAVRETVSLPRDSGRKGQAPLSTAKRPAASAAKAAFAPTRPIADSLGTAPSQARLAATAATASAAPSPAPGPSSQPADEQRDGGFWDGLKNAAKAVGGAIVKGAKAVGNAIANGAKAVGRAIVSVGKAVWHWGKSAGDRIYTWGAQAWGKVREFFGVQNIKRESGTLWTRKIERDPGDVNATGPFASLGATIYLATHAKNARAALAKLSPDDRARYERVFKATGSAVGQAALQNWLIAGKLPGTAARGGDRGTLLSQLDRMASQPLAGGIARRDLLSDTILEIADPAAINQHKKGTCVATVAAILLAKQDPAEYARLVGGLASPEGTVRTAMGDVIAREADWKASDGGRSTPQRLLEPAFMELGNGNLDYRNGDDKSFSEDEGSEGTGGLSSSDSARLLTSVMGTAYKSVWVDDKQPGSLDAVFDKLKARLTSGERVPCSLLWIKGSHKILAERISGDRVYYTNPWGKEESLSIAEFKARLTSFNSAT
jgi:hypothetical protein